MRKTDYLLVKRVKGVTTEVQEFSNADDLLNAARKFQSSAPPDTSYQTVYGMNAKKDYAVGDVGDEFDLLDEMEE